MNANTNRAKASHPVIASFACGLAVVLSACGATAAQSVVSPESQDTAAQAQISAGSFSLDYNTAQNLGRLESVGSFSLDYNTAQHLGRLESVGSFTLDYDTAQHMGRLEGGVGSFSLDYDTAQHLGWLEKMGK
jgi:hypothetical protein